MISQRNIAGVVVLYNSPAETLHNILTYIHQVETLYVVDNSSSRNDELIRALQTYPNVHYHSLNGNKGIATALNWAAKQALQDGFTVLLTMDDDTQTPTTMMAQMIEFWNGYGKPIGILSGVHHTKSDAASYRRLPYTLTSGNLLNLKAYQITGPFYDDLFIDHVDHEYGLRLNQHKYEVIELPSIRLGHQLGYAQQIKIGNWVVRNYGTHSPIRQYYFARNGVYVALLYFKAYPSFSWMVAKELVKRLIKASVLDENGKSRVKMLLQGVIDGWRGQLGKYPQ